MRSQSYIGVDDYLHGEQVSDVRHEYVDGQVFAMVGASDRHGIIAVNLGGLLSQRLPDRCQVFISDMRVRIRAAEQEIFYYPDVLVSCDAADRETYYRTRPCLVAEVLSPATERVDRFEKLFSYRTLESLEEYLLVTQDYRQVEVFRRARGWRPEIYVEGDVPLTSVGLSLGFDQLYRRVFQVLEQRVFASARKPAEWGGFRHSGRSFRTAVRAKRGLPGVCVCSPQRAYSEGSTQFSTLIDSQCLGPRFVRHCDDGWKPLYARCLARCVSSGSPRACSRRTWTEESPLGTSLCNLSIQHNGSVPF